MGFVQKTKNKSIPKGWVILSIFVLATAVSFSTTVPAVAEHEDNGNYSVWDYADLLEKHKNKSTNGFFEEQRPYAIDFEPYTGVRWTAFDDDVIDVCHNSEHWVWKFTTYQATKLWQTALANATTGDKNDWKFKGHDGIEGNDCDITINYQDVPLRTDLQVYGVLGLMEMDDSHGANVTVFTRDWTKTVMDIPEEQWETITLEEYQDIVVNGTHQIMDGEAILRVTAHELGHAFGSDHPYLDMMGKKNPPSIMDYNRNNTIISNFDALQVVEKYTNGWEDRTATSYHVEDTNRPMHSFYIGERATFIIDFPRTQSVTTITDNVSLYFFEGGKGGKKLTEADAKIFKGKLAYASDVFQNMDRGGLNDSRTGVGKSFSTNFEREVDNVDIVVIKHSKYGTDDQFIIENAFNVVEGKYSKYVLDYEPPAYWFQYGRGSINLDIEQEIREKHLEELKELDAKAEQAKDRINRGSFGDY